MTRNYVLAIVWKDEIKGTEFNTLAAPLYVCNVVCIKS